ncbi:carboxypeptidase-like regulatory domain-containing protein [Vulgatibacter incomptus]|uniref:Carboxypeptidase regulatory-like domain-containing protein n=1 Tax=Vulgatibacter incomptus TaxID=1391653 RepID=A0A0K1PIB5_9BACT|nr:carboxypeptidase-like regulatory domain-containing protein [Vulgatibacter incomptus]AKU93156.1 hypothetical protein AKJ08_3543 [Vulgatibacter incomptus]
MKRKLASFAVFATLVACGDDSESKPCKVDDPRTCSKGLVCEPVVGEADPACFRPVEIRGSVIDLRTEVAIAAARVNAEEASGRPIGDVAETGIGGTYAIRIPSTRQDGSGAPVGQTITLRAAARDYVPFPSGFRVALPLDTAQATEAADGAWVVAGGPAVIGLEPLPSDRVGLASISGTVGLPSDGSLGFGTMVVAERASGGETITGRVNQRGEFVLFNVPPGSYTVQAYRRGVNYVAAGVAVERADVKGVRLDVAETGTATLAGSVSIVAGNGATSVVMVLESTFDETLARGILVPGLRAPEPGLAPNIKGDFRIDGIPDGRYVILAAFENDGLVRDPDPDISGTQIQHIVVSGGVTSASPKFKVTSAVRMVGPGAGETVEAVTGQPTFRWQAYSSAKRYDVELFDNFGTRLWIKSVTTTNAAYDGAVALEPGFPYQWRLTAFGNAGNPISMTEDLRGVFEIAP